MTSVEQGSGPGIVCKENGPYIIKNVRRMTGTGGETIDVKPVMALCRCGQSGNKPFCDGSHVKARFSGENDLRQRTTDRKDTYTGKRLSIHDNRGICAHAGVCTDKLNNVFRMKMEPWIDPDQASTEEIKAVIDKCPSGALSYSIDGEEPSNLISEVTINVLPDGPFEIVGDIEISDASLLQGASKNICTLCRCGQSNNKPFCDGSHWSAGFKDA